MRFFRTSNPIYRSAFRTEASAQPVTYTSVAGKTVLLVVITAITGTLGVVYIQFLPSWTIFAAVGIAFVSSLLGLFIPKAAAFFSILYAATEGIVLGLISFMFEASYQGIVLTAVSTTVIVLLVMMILFSMNIVKIGQGFTSFLVVAMITTIVMSIVLVFTASPPLYYLVCILSAILATLYLFLDFSNIQRCVEQGLDHRVGWTLALGLMVSLVWLYIEILRLLAIFAGRRR
ncbi:MAG: Bax inhibitor-1/YccA family protein [Bacillota bacterium]|nr:Bax inhibitor-1/YccA family protein [Bacillota bacterium]